MRIKDIPVGCSLFVDANILVYANQNESVECANLMRRLSNAEIQIFVTTHILAEVMHRLMLIEVRNKNLIAGSNPVKKLNEKPEIIKSMWEYNSLMRNILDSGFIIEPVNSDDLHLSLRFQRLYGLMTNDSLFLAVAYRLGIKAIASADKAFRNIPTIDLYEPGDL